MCGERCVEDDDDEQQVEGVASIVGAWSEECGD